MSSQDQLRFLFVSSDRFPPFRVDVSVLFGKKMVERGHTIDWVLQSEESLQKACRKQWSGCRVMVGPTDNGTSMMSRARKNLYSMIHDLKMLRMLRKNRYDFILVKDKFFAALSALFLSSFHKIKFVYWLSYPFPEASLFEVKEGTARYPLIYRIRGHLLMFLLYRLILPFADHIFVQSEQMKKDIALRGIPEEKMTPVPMGVSTDEIPFFGYEPEGDTSNGRKKTVLYLGTLIKVRRMDFLVRAFEKVLRKGTDARLCFVGRGEDASDEQMLRDEAERLGIGDAVSITGFLPQQEAWQYVKGADVCVSPFYPTPILNSTSPTKLIEYMAMGKAVVANDHPEQSLVIAESKGGICVPYEELAFGEAIAHLLNHREEAEQMGVSGRKYVEKHRSYERIADLVENRLLQLCGSS